MGPAARQLRCVRCREAGTLTPVAPRVLRCAACGFLAPPPRATPPAGGGVQIPELPGLAPEGLLRGKYRLVERLGEGAQGISYLAEHEYLSHLCVVKFLPRRIGDATDAAIRRLREEARAGFRVNDPHVVRVLDCDVASNVWYFVMEYIDGVDLAALLADGLRASWQQAAALGADAARGLAAIHQAGLLHRDIKPGNLLLGADGRVRVADLGVVGLAHERCDTPPIPGSPLAGTLAYAAPEMFRPDAGVGPPADLYSLGVTLYQFITGRLPHAATQVFQQLIDVQCRPAAWPAEAAGAAPDWLVELILALLAIEPHERPVSAEAVLARLESPRAAAPGPPPRAADALEPRAIGVLPFQNERAAPDDDWLGYAVANYLSRALAEHP
ncbi:MAG: serine/threonine-protein kinase, partial [Planctomycetota bacterium]